MKSVKHNTRKTEQIRLTEVQIGRRRVYEGKNMAVTISRNRGGLPTHCTITVMAQTCVLMIYKSTFLLSERNDSEGPRRAELRRVWAINFEEGQLVMKLVGSEVLSAMILKSIVFWDVTPCSPADVPLYFRETCCFHHEDRRQAKKVTIKKHPKKTSEYFSH
jgi:hypothetical protein